MYHSRYYGVKVIQGHRCRYQSKARMRLPISRGRIQGVATCAVEALAIWSSEAPDENQYKIRITAVVKSGFLLLQTLYGMQLGL